MWYFRIKTGIGPLKRYFGVKNLWDFVIDCIWKERKITRTIPRFLQCATGYIGAAFTEIGNAAGKPGWGVICPDFIVP